MKRPGAKSGPFCVDAGNGNAIKLSIKVKRTKPEISSLDVLGNIHNVKKFGFKHKVLKILPQWFLPQWFLLQILHLQSLQMLQSQC